MIIQSIEKGQWEAADALGIAAETVASKRELSAIIISGNRESRVFSGWRKDVIGDALQRHL